MIAKLLSEVNLDHSNLIQHSGGRGRFSYPDLAPLAGDTDLRLSVRNSTPVGPAELCNWKNP